MLATSSYLKSEAASTPTKSRNLKVKILTIVSERDAIYCDLIIYRKGD